MKPVTDPEILKQLGSPVTDPKLLAQLEGKPKGPDAFDERIKADLKESGGYLENLGAGIDNVWQGAKQLVGQGDDDATIEERRKIKQQLAEGRTGGGLTQLAGEIIATALPSAGAGALVGKVGARALPKAAAWLGSKGSRVFNLGNAGKAAVEGAVGGSLAETTEDESRGLNTAVGGVMGAALPLAAAGVAGGRKILGANNAGNRAAARFQKHLGPENMADIADALDSPSTGVLPLSTAAKSKNTSLAALERGARGRGTDIQFKHDRPVMERAGRELIEATSDADQLGARVADREEMMRASKDMLNETGSKTSMKRANKALGQEIEGLRATPIARQNPDITNELGKIEQMLQHPEATPGDFASQYWRVSGMADNPNLTPEQKEILIQLKGAIANAADDASNGSHFSDLLGRYKAEQGFVGEAESAKAIREAFVSPQGVPAHGSIEGTPNIPARALSQTLAKRGENEFGSTISDPTRQRLTGLQKELEAHELWKTAASPGATNAGTDANPVTVFGSGANNPANRIWALRGVGNMLLGGAEKDTTKVADAALMNPDVWKRMMEEYAKSNSPLSPKEYAARMMQQLLRTPGRAGTAALGGE